MFLSLAALLWGCALYVALPWIGRHLRPPAGEPADIYRALLTTSFRVRVATSGALATLVCAHYSTIWWWLPLLGPCLIAGWIDAATRYLPRQLHRAAVMWCGPVLLARLLQGDVDDVVRAVVGASLSTALLWGLWRWGRFGFGDVRLAGITGFCCASVNWQTWYLGLLWGTAIGAVWGLIVRCRGNREPFAYGPSLLLGAVAALPLGA